MQYRKLLQERGASQYRLVSKTDNPDAIIEQILVNDPDFSDLDALTEKIEVETLKFIEAMEGFFQAARRLREIPAHLRVRKLPVDHVQIIGGKKSEDQSFGS